GILDYNRPSRLNPEELCPHQVCIRGGFSGQMLRTDHVAIHSYLEEVGQLGGLQDSRAVLTRGDDGDFESMVAELMDELDASLVGLHPHSFDHLVDQIVLAVPQPAHCFGLWGVVQASLEKADIARGEKVANSVEARLAVHIEPVIGSEIKGAKCFAALRRTLVKVLIEHLLPTRRVQVGGVGYHTVEVKKDGVIFFAGDYAPALGLSHRSLSVTNGHSLLIG